MHTSSRPANSAIDQHGIGSGPQYSSVSGFVATIVVLLDAVSPPVVAPDSVETADVADVGAVGGVGDGGDVGAVGGVGAPVGTGGGGDDGDVSVLVVGAVVAGAVVGLTV